MNRGERRSINKRKWINKLKKIYKNGWDWYRLLDKYADDVKKFDGRVISPQEWKDLMKTKDGVLYKNTRTKWKKEKGIIPMDDIKMLHKRDLKNKSIPEDQLFEAEKHIEINNDMFAFEKYCGACDLFETSYCPNIGKVDEYSEWGKIVCNKFRD